MRKIGSTVIIGLFFLLAFFVGSAYAAEFEVIIDREYKVEVDGVMKVVETHTVKNNSTTLLISRTNQETFQIPSIDKDAQKLKDSVATAVITVDGVKQNFTPTYQDKYADLAVTYPKEVRRGASLVFKLEYQNFGLVEKTGALFDVYAPGFVEGFQFEKGLTKVVYNTKFTISKALPPMNFVVPAAQDTMTSDTHISYIFSQDSLIGQTIWIQLGKVQYYKFKIEQQAPKTDERDTGYKNEYRLILPRDVDEGEVEQKIYFSNLSPKPFQVLKDAEENLIAYYKLPTHEDTAILIEGYAQVQRKEFNVGTENGGELSAIPQLFKDKYTKQAQYWEVDAPAIQSQAKELKSTNTNVYKIVADTYQHIVDTIDYSEVKRFGLNERQGALNTLNGGAAVCMEYSDLFLTLSRAQGIPARAAFGYGYDARLATDNQEAHQWVQVYMPGVDKWVSVDVTWGESGPALIGGDLNHFYTHVAAIDPNNPAMVERVSYGDNVSLLPPKFDILAQLSIPSDSGLLSAEQLLVQYPEVKQPTISESVENILKGFNAKTIAPVLVIGGVLVLVVSLLLMSRFLLRSKQTQIEVERPMQM